MKRFQSVAGLLVTVAAGVFVLAAATSSEAVYEKQELKCSKGLAKSVTKLTESIVKTTAKCLDGDISGKKVQSCSPLSEKDQGKITKAVDKVYKTASKGCASTCSTAQDVTCIGDLFCPPRNTTSGRCSGKGSTKFNYTNLGFPGFFCPEAGILNGADMVSSDDIALCVSSIGSDIADTILAQTYGSLTSAASISEAAAGCLKEIGKTVPKTISSITKAVGKCRDKQNSLSVPTLNPADCQTADQKTADSISKAMGKFEDALDKKCTNATIAELDICGNGVGGTADVATAKTCLGTLIQGVIESDDLPDDRTVARATLIDAAYPDRQQPTCGDNKVNQIPSAFYLLGEECDGTDDSACPGQCGAPGDVWECTCLDIPRIRQFTDGPTSDLDSGWTGSSHDSQVTDGAGYITTQSDCNCDAMTDATCTGSTTDSVCTAVGDVHPVCSYSPGSAQTCDQIGDNNGLNSDSDCRVCDSRSVNAGSYCTTEGDCQSQCFDADTMTAVAPQVLCNRQSDCGTGEICLGRCDDSGSCIFIPDGAPLPISAGGTAVCVISLFTADASGTQDLVTGEHAIDYVLASYTHLATSIFRPCPVCGGVCGGGARKGSPCEGTCEGSSDSCRFDSDCDTSPGAGDGVCTTESPDCPDSGTTGEAGFCNLSLICSEGAPGSVGKACRVEAQTPFGTTSGDCLPDNNVSGEAGLTIKRLPTTSEKTSQGIPGPANACQAPGYENFDCICPGNPRGNGAPSRPNGCRAACDAPGANFGVGCGIGNTNGVFTVCVGGDEDGAACDADSDCSGGGACSGNPTHCTAGDADKLLDTCTTNGDCGAGGVCGDACPGGRCVPLCVTSGVCSGGDKDGFDCGTNVDCIGGGTCGAGPNPYEGVCAAGPPFTHCGGAGFGFVVCVASNVGTQKECEYGVDGIQGTDDDIPGAGYCITDVRDCFLTDPSTGAVGIVEGGDIFNGKGDPTNYYTASAYCIPDSQAPSVNNTAGLGGGGRQQAYGVNVPNFTTLP